MFHMQLLFSFPQSSQDGKQPRTFSGNVLIFSVPSHLKQGFVCYQLTHERFYSKLL